MSYKFEESQYYLTINMEVLNELAAEVLGGFVRYFTEKNIEPDDRNQLLVLIYWELVSEKKRIISSEVKEIKDLYLIEGKLVFGKQILEKAKGLENGER